MVEKPKKQPEEPFKVEIYDIMGDYVFTEDEKRAMAQDLASKNIGLQGLEEERKAVVSNYKARIDQTNAEIGVLANYLAQGKKQQMYKCYLDFDRTRKMRLWKEQKTHRVIKEEPMKEEDAQIKFGQGTR